MFTLIYELVDQPEVEYEREFATGKDGLQWMMGVRETDFQWIELHTPSGDIVADGWSDCLGVLK